MTKTWSLALGVAVIAGAVNAEEPTLAEDPFAIQKAQHAGQASDRPWKDHSPEELRAWAKKNMHHKLKARRVIDAEAHPEWAWFRKAGLGLFLHWGPACLPPSNGDAWAMVWNEHRSKNNLLQKPEAMFAAAENWNPKNYDPDKWMQAASKAGFGYAVLTTRHHDGYCLFPSEHGEWDTGDQMGGKDLVKDYVEACRKHGLRTGFYYSGPNWHFDYKNKDFSHPPQGINYKHEKVENDPPLAALMGYSPPLPGDGNQREQNQSTEQVRELMTKYGPIDLMWWDGNLIMTEEELAKLQPDIFVARGNIATPEGRHHGLSENVKVTNEAGWWWELCIKPENEDTPNWHYSPVLEENHWDAGKLLSELVRCRSLGGNLLVNVPPRPNGEMMDWFYEICEEMAEWMEHSREAVVDVELDAPRPTLDITENFVTTRGNSWYAMPNDEGRILIREIRRPESVHLLRTGEPLEYEFENGSLRITVPEAMRTGLPDMVKITSSSDSAQADVPLAPDRLIPFKTVDGDVLKLHVFEPEGHQASEQRPAILFFFGGGWSGGTPKQFYEQAQHLADRGMVAMSAEYRVKSRHQSTPFESVQDAKSAIRWVRQHAEELGVDPDRIVASGGSAGGHVAACTGVIEGFEEEGEDHSIRSVPNAMILFNPVLDTTARGFGLKHVGADRQTEISPCHHVRPGVAPTLLFHGTADTTVPFENAERFARRMKESGNSCELKAFEGRKHGFFNGQFFRPKLKNTSDYSSTMEDSVAFLAALGYLDSGESSAPKPNIVVFLADDMGWGDAACYGHDLIKTPNLDKLASEGVRFLPNPMQRAGSVLLHGPRFLPVEPPTVTECGGIFPVTTRRICEKAKSPTRNC